METTLIFAEIVFFLTMSAVIITIGILCVVITVHLVRIARELEALSRNFNHMSSEAGERLNEIIDRISSLPILSYFLKKRSKKISNKN